ncbi:phasin family protein [Bradyrhizobium sp.]|uniref:phasin family protein n=1 Tax=Bradyrhizobium sp. TaxID=376 RepID=UPI002604636B|nr:phasin family protein [Bradyrhizobium sp.]
MPTTQEEKPVKPRSRSRKADRKAAKAEAKVQAAPAQVSVAAEPVSAMMAAAIEAAAAEVPQAESAPAETAQADVALNEVTPDDAVPVAAMIEKAPDAALSGEVLPPEVRKVAQQTTSLSAIALAHGDYTRKSWLAGRFLVERLMAVRSFEEAIEVHGEFAKQACENFIAHSQRICALYGEWAQQFLTPYEKLAEG